MRPAGFFIALACFVGLSACSHETAARLLPAAPFVSSVLGTHEPIDNASFRSIYSFGKIANDGAPQSSPLSFNGAIYGTTTDGGASAFGTVFSITPQGLEKIRHNFKGTDGSQPVGDMIESDKVLYGTTYTGGAIGAGVVFSLSRNGTFKVLHSFADNAVDGGLSESGLVKVGSTFDGTTEGGGKNGVGTLFSITSAGDEHVLHFFGSRRFGAGLEFDRNKRLALRDYVRRREVQPRHRISRKRSR